MRSTALLYPHGRYITHDQPLGNKRRILRNEFVASLVPVVFLLIGGIKATPMMNNAKKMAIPEVCTKPFHHPE